MTEVQRRMLGGLEDFSENLRDKHRRHWMVCGIICGKHTDGASVRIGCGCSFFLQNPLSPRWDECHADGIKWSCCFYPLDGLLTFPTQEGPSYFLNKWRFPLDQH